jgi:aminoglycoside/choline kinase family phosphotransferase
VALKGDASTRRFWRITIASSGSAAYEYRGRAAEPVPASAIAPVPTSAIAIDLGPDDLPLYARVLRLVDEPLPEPPWLTLQRFLRSIAIAVPELYAADTRARMLLVEDVGEAALFDAAASGDAGDLYRLAVDELVRLHLEGTGRLPLNSIVARVAYDERLFRWELEQFVDVGAAIGLGRIDRAAIAPELDTLAARLGRLPRVLSHRDYHGHNLFVQAGADSQPLIRVIDFQDALMAPAAQDLAVLLTTRDTARLISERVEQRLIDYYYAAILRQNGDGIGFNEFIESYRLCVIQHALKVIGRFVYLERNGKPGYAKYLPYVLEQGRRMLSRSADFPALRSALLE